MDPPPAASDPPKTPLPNSFWVLPGKLLAGEYPGALTPQHTRARLAQLLASGINSFIDLTEPDEVTAYNIDLPRGIDYARLPITDHGVPEQPARMAEILARLRAALGSGRIVYLHCRAGIGRTTTVVGCLLAEQGSSGEEALRELNRLWQQNERAAYWPTVPETLEQTEYVRGWRPVADGDPLLDPAALAAAAGLRARFQGALLGLATGDAVAAATQYRRPDRVTPVGDLLGGGPFDLPRGGWSDDTAMALCLADSLLECGGFDARDQVERYRRWQREGYLSATGQCVGITAGTARALAQARWRRQPFSGTHDTGLQEPEALSRVAPVAMYFFAPGEASAERAAGHAAEAARTTSQAPAVLAACRSLAEALHAALCGLPKSALAATPAQVPGPRAEVGSAGTSTDTAPAALAAALEAFAGTDNFREAVLAAANLGGNCDVVASVCGALAGAHYGAAAIPASWRNSLMKKQLIEEYADRLLAHALLELGAT